MITRKNKSGGRYTEVNVERTHSQIRNPAWTSFSCFSFAVLHLYVCMYSDLVLQKVTKVREVFLLETLCSDGVCTRNGVVFSTPVFEYPRWLVAGYLAMAFTVFCRTSNRFRFLSCPVLSCPVPSPQASIDRVGAGRRAAPTASRITNSRVGGKSDGLPRETSKGVRPKTCTGWLPPQICLSIQCPRRFVDRP